MYLRLRIGKLAAERGMLVSDLAREADISTNTARALIRGVNERVDIPVLEKVARALKVRPLELFEEVEESPGQPEPLAWAA